MFPSFGFITRIFKFLDLHTEKSRAPRRILIRRRKIQRKKDFNSLSGNYEEMTRHTKILKVKIPPLLTGKEKNQQLQKLRKMNKT